MNQNKVTLSYVTLLWKPPTLKSRPSPDLRIQNLLLHLKESSWSEYTEKDRIQTNQIELSLSFLHKSTLSTHSLLRLFELKYSSSQCINYLQTFSEIVLWKFIQVSGQSSLAIFFFPREKAKHMEKMRVVLD